MRKDETTRFEADAPDRQLIRWILDGAHVQEAWTALLDRYSNLIYTVPLRYGLQQSDAADVYQSVCEMLWQEMVHLRDHDRLASWLLTTAGRASWRVVMDRRRHMLRESPVLDDDPPLPDTGPRPDEIVLRSEEWSSVAAAVRELPDRCRELIRYLYYDQTMLPYEEIARRLGLAEGSIGPIRARCLSQLKKNLRALRH